MMWERQIQTAQPFIPEPILLKVGKLKSTESSKYYARIQTAVAHGLGLPAGRQAGHDTDAASKHSVISVHFPSRWSCASTYICKAETLAFTDCDYCYTLVL